MSYELRESEEEEIAALCDDRMLAWIRSPYNYVGVRATREDNGDWNHWGAHGGDMGA